MNKYDKKNVLWYRQPALKWTQALPVGNGRLAGMVCGRVFTERIFLNEDSIWSGGPQSRNNPDALKNLEKVRALIFQGKIKEAESLASLTMTGTPDGQRYYQPLGDLFIFFRGHKQEFEDYERELDLNDGVVRIKYRMGGVTFKREVFASYPDQVLAVKLTADKAGALNFLAQLSRGAFQIPWISQNEDINRDVPIDDAKMRHPVSYQGLSDGLEIVADDTVVLKGSTGGEKGIHFRAVLKVSSQGGTVHTIGDHICVENAESATLIVSACTDYRSEDPENTSLKTAFKASQKPYEKLLADHVADYKSLFERVAFEIEDDDTDKAQLNMLPTDIRLNNIKNGGCDRDLISLCFQYGRYLMIAGSRPGSLPNTLQGKWTYELIPMWGSKYTININIQMNYWPSEKCNLSECHEPLFDLIEMMRKPGRETAKQMYGCKGFAAHHNTDIWSDTAPQDIFMPASIWPMGALWLCLHLWEHFEFTGDTDFLKNAYETMKEAAQFFLDYLIDDGKGNLVTCPSISPENSYLLSDGTPVSMSMGCAMDLEMIHELFGSLIKAIDILGIDGDFRAELAKAISKLKKPTIGKYGQIQEWYEDYPEAHVGHYHFSPIFSLFPGSWFSPIVDPDYAKAARTTLERRTNHWNGYSAFPAVWAVNLWARLYDGDKACSFLNGYMKESLGPNLFNRLSDLDYSFQIDANFGFTSGVAEMLLQSHAGVINILPALPREWPNGRITGLKARGGFLIDISWTDGRLMHAAIKSALGNVCKIRTNEEIVITCGKEKVDTYKDSKGNTVFPTSKKTVYFIDNIKNIG